MSFTIKDKDGNDKTFDESKLSDKGKIIYNKLIRLAEDKNDIDLLINIYVSKLTDELPKEVVANGSESEE